MTVCKAFWSKEARVFSSKYVLMNLHINLKFTCLGNKTVSW